MFDAKELQSALRTAGYDVAVDGIIGQKTKQALLQFKKVNGLPQTLNIDQVTGALLGLDLSNVRDTDALPYPPWLTELGELLGLHEVDDNRELRAWLRSDGRTLGDPAKNPWCGDAIETAIRNALPREPLPGALGDNPYWARHWAKFGVKSPLRLGVVVVLTRTGGGHVGFAIGQDRRRGLIQLRGGNQSDAVTDAWMRTDRVLAYRKPSTWPHDLPPLPNKDAYGRLSTNEQ